MTVAIGPVLLLLASILLGAVLILAAIGIILWMNGQERWTRDESEEPLWEQDPADLAGRDSATIVAPGK